MSKLAYTLQVLLHLAQSYTPLSNKTLQSLPRPGSDFDIHNGEILTSLLQPRISGTPGSEAVRQHITNFFASNLPDWNIEYQKSSSKVPLEGSPRIPFTNIIVSRDPPGVDPHGVGRLTLAAHYDTIRDPEGYIGAIDSSAPCAMLMHAARSIDQALTRKWAGSTSNSTEQNTGIQILFLDGEETFEHTLRADDGLYGSRSLAANWATDTYPESSKIIFLLDLLGSKGPTIPSFYPVTHKEYRRLASLENRMRGMGQFHSQGGEASSKGPWFVDEHRDAVDIIRKPVEDDQIPFSALGVKVLHVIDLDPDTELFSTVWHTMDDDGEHLHTDTVGDWSVLVTAFVAEWLELDRYFT